MLRVGTPGPTLAEGSMAVEDSDPDEEELEMVAAAGAAGDALGDTGSPTLVGEASSEVLAPLEALLGVEKGLLLNEGRRKADKGDSPPCEMLSSVRVRSSPPRVSWNEAICVLMGSDMRLLK